MLHGAGGPLDSVSLVESDLGELHEGSWLLIPLTLTSALVIHGAMRQAARDAAIKTGDDDE